MKKKDKLIPTEEDNVKESKVVPITNEEPISLIKKELDRFQKQVDELFQVLESVVLLEIEDPEDRLKAADGKLKIQKQLPQLLLELDNLKNREQTKSEDVRGSASLSPLENGLLD